MSAQTENNETSGVTPVRSPKASGQFVTGVLLVAAAGLLWGGMGTSVQHLFALDIGFTPLGLVAFRQLSAGILFVALATLVNPRKTWQIFHDPRLALDIFAGGAFVFLAHYSFFESIYYSNAGTGAILLTTVPLFAALWYALRKKEAIGRVEVACFLLAASGVLLIVTDGDFSALKFSPMALVWGLVSAVFAAAYSIHPIRAIKAVGVTPVVAWGILSGGIIASFVSPPWTIDITWSWDAFASFAFIVVFGTVIAFWCFMGGLKYISPVAAGLLNCLEPLSAFLFSALLLGDRLGLVQLIGIALVIGNVVLLSLSKR